MDTELEMEKQYKPIIRAIKTHDPLSVKQEMKAEDHKSTYDDDDDDVGDEKSAYDDDSDLGPMYDESQHEEFKPSMTSTPRADAELTSFLETDEGQADASQFLSKHFLNDLTREYMDIMIRNMGNKTTQIDHNYGPRYESSRLMVGDSPLEFDDNGNIKVAGTSYKPTRGLYELLFKRVPDKNTYDEDDLQAYKDILIKTNAHKKNYLHGNKINRLTGSTKYKEVISKLFPLTATTGSGFVKSVSTRDISYWDDPNELCDRLRLLVASAETGNMGHGNEMLNIVEELREAGLIKGQGNKRFRSFLQ
ncbi:MAG: hypothetical protein E6K54_00025 [Gammaproteobacteria bacterium]|nr:MAG: hypothetical protein E6K54_00025 [Gammaproteobacteria bacterium]